MLFPQSIWLEEEDATREDTEKHVTLNCYPVLLFFVPQKHSCFFLIHNIFVFEFPIIS